MTTPLLPHAIPLAGPPLTATYRLQLGPHLDFDGARALVPYLKRLGVSHLYLSPVLEARTGSTHGYDVVDPSRANPALGGDAAFVRLADAARAAGLGIVLDVVPNHMGAGPENPYWDDVLALGEHSPHARWFDVDWQAFARRDQRQVVLPVLGDELPRALELGHVTVELAPPGARAGGFRVRYFEHSLPVDPRTAHRLFAFTHEHAFDDPADAAAVRAARGALMAEGGASLGVPEARAAVAALAEAAAARAGVRAYVEGALRAFAAGEDGRGRLEALLSLQHWRLTYWRRAWRELNYRRFFDVSDLVGLRAEDPAVFEATHAWALARVAEGRVHALRVDHVDGLRDPLGYLRRLRAALDARSPGAHVPVFVEKILVGDEKLRETWPVDGTTGYEALNAVEGAFVHALGAESLERFYRRLLGARGAEARFQEVAVRGKEYVLRRAFRPEIRRAVRALMTVARDAGRLDAETAGGVGAPLGGPALAEAVLELAATLPVYRTYVTPAGGEPGPQGGDAPGPLAADQEDLALVDDALARALRRGAAEEDALRLAAGVLVGDVPDPAAPASARVRRAAAEFALRFQQTSGPATAKGVEDTALYRWSPLASLCEVGGEPDRPLGTAVARLHAANAERLAHTPRALVTVGTHDTKRSADARARLDALAEVAGEWRGLVERWRKRHAALRRPTGAGSASGGGRPAPDAAAESLLYQTLVAVWPADGRFNGRDQADDAFAARVLAYVEKAAREAKQSTSWTSPQADYEGALADFARALMQGDAGAEFRRELGGLVARVAAAGAWTSLARTVAYAAAPGTPDVYQGDELWHLALVDPDNRRPVDWAAREAALGAAEAEGDAEAWWRAHLAGAPRSPGEAKLRVLRAVLHARAADPALFAAGSYTPLLAQGPRAGLVLAFAREHAGRAVVAVAPRLPLLVARDGAPPVGALWDDTALALPDALGPGPWRDLVSGRVVEAPGGRLRVADALAVAPAALLRAEGGV